MGFYTPFNDALAKAEHYVALGQTEIHLDKNDPNLPWDSVVEIESGGSFRLNGPSGFRVIAKTGGLIFIWYVDFEGPGANGQSYYLFNRDHLHETMRKLPPAARKKLADWMETDVLPGVEAITAQWRGHLNNQIKSEDCVREMIAFARAQQ